jgi:enoyl-CoA hydratase/carnithine racemase
MANTIMRGLKIWKPIIAAINGHALGGGLELAMACDLRIAAENATFGQPEVRLGLIPGWGGTQRLPRLIPKAKAAEILLMAQNIDAAEAYRIGLINKVVPLPDLIPTATEWAENICKLGPLAVRAAKQAMIEGESLTLEDGLSLEWMLEEHVLSTEDFEEGTKAFLEKKTANFKAR